MTHPEGDSAERAASGRKRFELYARDETGPLYTLFRRILDEAGGDIPADFVVDTALKVDDARLLPALRLAYDKKAVSSALKARILRTLGKAESGEYRSFLSEVAADEAAPEDLRKAAGEALGQN